MAPRSLLPPLREEATPRSIDGARGGSPRPLALPPLVARLKDGGGRGGAEAIGPGAAALPGG